MNFWAALSFSIPWLSQYGWSLFIWKGVEFERVGGYVTGTFQRSVFANLGLFIVGMLRAQTDREHNPVFMCHQSFSISVRQEYFIYHSNVSNISQ